MFEAFIRFLITILIIALCVFLFIWVMGIIGITFPPMVMKIIYAIAALVCLLFLVQFLRPHWGGWWGPKP